MDQPKTKVEGEAAPKKYNPLSVHLEDQSPPSAGALAGLKYHHDYHGLTKDTARVLGLHDEYVNPETILESRDRSPPKPHDMVGLPDHTGQGLKDLDVMVKPEVFEPRGMKHLSSHETAVALSNFKVEGSTDITMPIAWSKNENLTRRGHISSVILAREAALGVEEEITRVAAELVMNAPLKKLDGDTPQADFWISSCSMQSYNRPLSTSILTSNLGKNFVCPRIRNIDLQTGGKEKLALGDAMHSCKFDIIEYERPLSELEVAGLRLQNRRIAPATGECTSILRVGEYRDPPARMVGFLAPEKYLFDEAADSSVIEEKEASLESDTRDAYENIKKYTDTVHRLAEKTIQHRRTSGLQAGTLKQLADKYATKGVLEQTTLVPLGIQRPSHEGIITLKITVVIGVADPLLMSDMIYSKPVGGIVHSNARWVLSPLDLESFFKYLYFVITKEKVPFYLVTDDFGYHTTIKTLAGFYKTSGYLGTTPNLLKSIKFMCTDRELLTALSNVIEYLQSSGEIEIKDTPQSLKDIAAELAEKIRTAGTKNE